MITDVIGGAVIHRSAPLSNVRFDVTLDGGSFAADIPIRSFGNATTIQYTDLPGPELDEMVLDEDVLDPQIATRVQSTGRPIITEDSYEPLRRVVWPCWNGEPYAPYLIMGLGAHDPVVDTTVSLIGRRADIAIMERTGIRDNIQFVNQDQFRIFRSLFEYGCGRNTTHATTIVNGASQRIAQGSWLGAGWETLSGVSRTRRIVPGNEEDGYPGNARKMIETCLSQLCNLENGFERTVRCTIDPVSGEPLATVVMAYPRVGQATPRVVFEYPGGNVSSCVRAKDGSNWASLVDYTGQEKNGSRPIGWSLDRTALNAGYPLLDRVFSASDVSSVTVLAAKARGRLTGKVPTTWQVTIDPRRQPVWGSYALGDHVLLRLRTTPVQDHDLRIIGISVAVSDDGQAVVTPTLQGADEVTVE